MEKNGQKWGIHEQIWIKFYIKISEIWRRLGKIGEMTGKKRSQKEYGCAGVWHNVGRSQKLDAPAQAVPANVLSVQ